MTRVLVCGGRDYADIPRVFNVLESYDVDYTFTLLIHGGAPGADKAACKWARSMKVPIQSFPANWKVYGKAAGPIRNRRMLVEGKPNLVIAFPGGRGTADMVKQAKEHGIEVIEISAR
jgi:hypothetical protein